MLLNLEHRNKKPNDIHEGKWNGLGGKFEAGETPEVCVQREVLEESGLVIQNPRLHGLLIFPKFKGNEWYLFVYTAVGLLQHIYNSSSAKAADQEKLSDPQPEPSRAS